LRIAAIRHDTVSISSPIRNAYIDFTKMDVSVVALVSDVERDGRQLVGYGFNSNGRYAPTGLLRDRFLPRLETADPTALLAEDGANLSPEAVHSVLMANEKPGGHGERSTAVGVIDMAIWDLVAKIEDVPLSRLLADRYGDGSVDDRVFVYAAGGYYAPGKDLAALQDEMRGYLDAGYSVVKMKIGGAPLDEDLARIEAVLEVTGRAGASLAVDANGRFDRETALAYGEALAPYGLYWYEEAGDPLDFELQSELAQAYPGPLATGENLFSHQDARNLLRYGGMRPELDVLQMDPCLSYGLVEFLRMLDTMAAHGWSRRRSIPHGGHQMALNIAAGLGLGGNESYPDLFQPYGGFPDGVRVEGGHITMPELPGIGFEGKSDLYAEMRALAA
jgi:L-alanine-DL-glutamate epimerase-like enolase superfamily enzyme